MDEYVSRELVKERFKKRLNWLKKDIHDEYSNALYDCCEYDTNLIDEIPVADVAPVVHGRWIMHDDEFGLTCECSACHIETMEDGNYCPNCGAKMDGWTGNGC